MNKNKKQIKQPLLPIEWIKEENKDERVYGSKRINLVRISQEKKIKKLQKVMLRWGDTFSHTTEWDKSCLLYTSPSPRDAHESRMPSSA